MGEAFITFIIAFSRPIENGYKIVINSIKKVCKNNAYPLNEGLILSNQNVTRAVNRWGFFDIDFSLIRLQIFNITITLYFYIHNFSIMPKIFYKIQDQKKYYSCKNQDVYQNFKNAKYLRTKATYSFHISLIEN